MTAWPRALWREIRAAPEDDAPRLIFADWLDERGEAWGEFIRAQCSLHRAAPGAPTDSGDVAPAGGASDRGALVARESALLAAHAARWARAWGLEACHAWRCERGFPVSAALAASDYIRQAARLRETAPLLREVGLYHAQRLLPRALPELSAAGVVSLQLYDTLEPEAAHALAESPTLPRLRSLGLARAGFDAGAARVLARASGAANLRALQFISNRLGDEGAQEIAGSRHLGQLEMLRLADCGVGAEGARALTLSRRLERLRVLGLWRNPLGSAAARALAVHARVARLRELDLASGGLDDVAAEALLASPLLTDMALLDIRRNAFSAALRARLQAKFERRVRV